MTYGVDQCRVCGVAIKQHGAEDMDAWLKAQRRPLIPEKEWRRRGFLAAPTRAQISMPSRGCCQSCGERLMRNRFSPGKRLAAVALAAAAATAIVWTIQTYAPFTGNSRGLNHEMPGAK